MKYFLLALCFLTTPVFPQTGAVLNGKAEKVLTPASAPLPTGSAELAPRKTMTVDQLARLQNENEKIRSDLVASVTRLNNLEGSIGKASDRADSASIRSSWFALATVLVSILASIGGQYLLIRHQRRLNREQEMAKVSNSYIEWQLKQLSELYGPLRAILGQSIAIYRQLNTVLIDVDPTKFRMVDKLDADNDDKEFQIFHAGDWVRFRTVEHLPVVYGKGFGVEPYFDDVVKAGDRMTEIIRSSAGYVRQEDKKLIQVMGEYLAHYGVLCRLHERALNGEDVKPTAADIKASFPHIIHKLVDKGFNAINDQVMDWKNFRPASNKIISL